MHSRPLIDFSACQRFGRATTPVAPTSQRRHGPWSKAALTLLPRDEQRPDAAADLRHFRISDHAMSCGALAHFTGITHAGVALDVLASRLAFVVVYLSVAPVSTWSTCKPLGAGRRRHGRDAEVGFRPRAGVYRVRVDLPSVSLGSSTASTPFSLVARSMAEAGASLACSCRLVSPHNVEQVGACTRRKT